MKIKSLISSFLRNFHLINISDKVRFFFVFAKNYNKIQAAKKKYSPFKFPPSYSIYETYHLDYVNYFLDGKQTAEDIVNYITKFNDSDAIPKKILDWGCGPARVIRHFPDIDSNFKAYGSDYNQSYIDWCKQNILNVSFIKNNTSPPIQFEDNTFDVIYGLSIITHLSEQNHISWINELYRILKQGGLLLITSQSDAFIDKLLPFELDRYQENKLVVRMTNHEGNRNYAAFQPKKYMQELLIKFKIIDFIPGGSINSIHGKQDTWLVRK